jgi:hypothetical protein
MKNKIGIWIDKSKAVIVSLANGKEEVKEIKSSINDKFEDDFDGDTGSFKGRQHIANEKKIEAKNESKFKTYLRDVAANLKGADEVYLFGPAKTKNSLRKIIIEDLNNLKFQLKSVETTDSMTLNQIKARVRTFFKHDLAH